MGKHKLDFLFNDFIKHVALKSDLWLMQVKLSHNNTMNSG